LPKPSLDSRRAWAAARDRFEALWLGRQYPEALALAQSLFDRVEGLFPNHPAVVRAAYDLAIAYHALGDERARDWEARAQQELARLRSLAQAEPRSDVAAWLLLYEGERLLDLESDAPAALERFREAGALFEALCGPFHPATGEALAREGELHFVGGDFALAAEAYARAWRSFEGAAAPVDSPWALKAAQGLALSLHYLNRNAEALPFFERAEALAADSPPVPQALYALWVGFAEACEGLSQGERAARLRARAAALLPKENPDVFTFRV
jgi:tetratricopeptide (TPR) repeat protein